jgi:hypothetical protein
MRWRSIAPSSTAGAFEALLERSRTGEDAADLGAALALCRSLADSPRCDPPVRL